MATYIKTLKEDNGDITYPQTKAGAVLLNNGSDLETELSQYVTAEDIASTSALTPPVQTNMIADGAVTKAKINFSTLKPYWRTLGVYNAASITIPSKYTHFRMFIRVQAAANTARLVINSPDRTNSNCWCNYYGVNASNEIHGAFNQPYTAGSGIAVAYIEPVNNNISKMFFATIDSFVYGGVMRSIVHMNSANDDIGCTIRSEAPVNITDAGLRLVLARGNATLTNIEWVVEVLDEN